MSIITPILGYAGITMSDLTSWYIVGQTLLGAISNPYVVGMIAVSLFNAFNDPTTTGVKDSARALTYTAPH